MRSFFLSAKKCSRFLPSAVAEKIERLCFCSWLVSAKECSHLLEVCGRNLIIFFEPPIRPKWFETHVPYHAFPAVRAVEFTAPDMRADRADIVSVTYSAAIGIVREFPVKPGERRSSSSRVESLSTIPSSTIFFLNMRNAAESPGRTRS